MYGINQGGLALNSGNYDLSYQGNNLTITKALLNVIADGKTKVYGGFLGMMYYFVPKQAERPVYSYRLSIVHFWALISLYIWAGPHHLHYTALPD